MKPCEHMKKVVDAFKETGVEAIGNSGYPEASLYLRCDPCKISGEVTIVVFDPPRKEEGA